MDWIKLIRILSLDRSNEIFGVLIREISVKRRSRCQFLRNYYRFKNESIKVKKQIEKYGSLIGKWSKLLPKKPMSIRLNKKQWIPTHCVFILQRCIIFSPIQQIKNWHNKSAAYKKYMLNTKFKSKLVNVVVTTWEHKMSLEWKRHTHTNSLINSVRNF